MPKMPPRLVLTVLVAPLLAASMTSCNTLIPLESSLLNDRETGTRVSTSITSGAGARDVARAISLEVLTQLEPDLIHSVDQRPHGALLSCTDVDYVWSGVSVAATGDDFTAERALSRLETWAEQADGRRAFMSHGSDGSPRIVVTVEDKGTYNVNVDPGDKGITLVAYSPCVHLAPDESVFDEY